MEPIGIVKGVNPVKDKPFFLKKVGKETDTLGQTDEVIDCVHT